MIRFYTKNILYCDIATSAEVSERPMTACSQSGLLTSLCECNNSEMKRSGIELLSRGADGGRSGAESSCCREERTAGEAERNRAVVARSG